MKQFRILLAVLLIVGTVLSLASCGAGNEKPDDTTVADTTVADTTVADTTEEAVEITFKAKVVDSEGNPVEGAYIQICKELCVFTATDKDGIAAFTAEQIPEIDDGYKLSVPTVPEGYVYNGEAEVYLEAGSTEYTVVLDLAK